MSTTGPRPPARRTEVLIPRSPTPELKQLGGSDSDHFNQTLAHQTLAALWVANSDDDQRNRQYLAATAALIGAKLQDELEGTGCCSAAAGAEVRPPAGRSRCRCR